MTTDFVASPTRPHFTTAEFLRMIESGAFDDMWVELVDGELERMPPPGRSHSARRTQVVARLLALFGEARVFGDVAIDLGDDTVLACDAALLLRSGGEGELIAADELALVIEIAVSSRDRDMLIKRRRYAAAVIPTYWVIDEHRSVIHVYDRPEGDDYMGIAVVRFGEPLAVPGTDGAITLD